MRRTFVPSQSQRPISGLLPLSTYLNATQRQLPAVDQPSDPSAPENLLHPFQPKTRVTTFTTPRVQCPTKEPFEVEEQVHVDNKVRNPSSSSGESSKEVLSPHCRSAAVALISTKPLFSTPLVKVCSSQENLLGKPSSEKSQLTESNNRDENQHFRLFGSSYQNLNIRYCA